MPLARHRVVGSPTPTKIYVLVLTTQLCAVSPRALSRQAITKFCVRQDVRFCPRGSVHWYVTERAWFSQRSITQNYALPAVNSCERQAITEFCVRQGVRFCPRGSVRWYVTKFSGSHNAVSRRITHCRLSRCLRGRPCNSPQCIPHRYRAERRRHPAEPEPALRQPYRPSRKSRRT